ncbi:MAG: hypothetical protein WD738_07310 [Pirellulales bacterium]
MSIPPFRNPAIDASMEEECQYTTNACGVRHREYPVIAVTRTFLIPGLG